MMMGGVVVVQISESINIIEVTVSPGPKQADYKCSKLRPMSKCKCMQEQEQEGWEAVPCKMSRMGGEGPKRDAMRGGDKYMGMGWDGMGWRRALAGNESRPKLLRQHRPDGKRREKGKNCIKS